MHGNFSNIGCGGRKNASVIEWNGRPAKTARNISTDTSAAKPYAKHTYYACLIIHLILKLYCVQL